MNSYTFYELQEPNASYRHLLTVCRWTTLTLRCMRRDHRAHRSQHEILFGCWDSLFHWTKRKGKACSAQFLADKFGIKWQLQISSNDQKINVPLTWQILRKPRFHLSGEQNSPTIYIVYMNQPCSRMMYSRDWFVCKIKVGWFIREEITTTKRQ